MSTRTRSLRWLLLGAAALGFITLGKAFPRTVELELVVPATAGSLEIAIAQGDEIFHQTQLRHPQRRIHLEVELPPGDYVVRAQTIAHGQVLFFPERGLLVPSDGVQVLRYHEPPHSEGNALSLPPH